MKYVFQILGIVFILSLFLNVFFVLREFSPNFNIKAFASSCEFDECYQDYYVILSSNLSYPKGCQSEGLKNAEQKCLLKIDGANIYVSPADTESIKTMPNNTASCMSNGEGACGYCNNLSTLGKTWFLPGSELSGLIDIYNNRSKILGLEENWYWSSTLYGEDGKDVRWFTRNMNMGDRTRNWHDQKIGVRCVSY